MERTRPYAPQTRIARGLQAALLPGTLPEAPGPRGAARYLPATRGMDIGGDFSDLIRVDRDHVAAVIGDVQGHNVNAAALMGRLRTAVQAHPASGVPPGEVMTRANRLLTNLNSDLSASCPRRRAGGHVHDHRSRRAARHAVDLLHGRPRRTAGNRPGVLDDIALLLMGPT